MLIPSLHSVTYIFYIIILILFYSHFVQWIKKIKFIMSSIKIYKNLIEKKHLFYNC